MRAAWKSGFERPCVQFSGFALADESVDPPLQVWMWRMRRNRDWRSIGNSMDDECLVLGEFISLISSVLVSLFFFTVCHGISESLAWHLWCSLQRWWHKLSLTWPERLPDRTLFGTIFFIFIICYKNTSKKIKSQYFKVIILILYNI